MSPLAAGAYPQRGRLSCVKPTVISPRQLADTYWEHYRLARSECREDRLRSDEVFWAWEMVDQIARCERRLDDEATEREPRLTPSIDRISLLQLLASRAPDDDRHALAYLGAGPLEDYLGHRPDLERVEGAARRDGRFRGALAEAWYDDVLPADDVARLRRSFLSG